MTAQRIDGRALAARVRQQVAERAAVFAAAHGRPPTLAVILVGSDAASQVYVRNKERAATEVGFNSTVARLPAETSQRQLEETLLRLGDSASIDGILLQLPLPAGLDAAQALRCIAPEKDVDGLHVINAGRLAVGDAGLRPCTPLGCMHLIQQTQQPIAGARALVIGRSRLVGVPAARLLTLADATVTIAHSRSQDLPRLVGQADIVVAAAGKPRMVLGGWIKPGSVVIDVGIHRQADGSLCGDVDFESAKETAGFLTPVPGGVGPMTIAMLLSNTIEAAETQQQA